ncbi:MAG: sigma-E factor negative regulatory protein [Burkholderiales bacterium]|nr:sigma-E factor negative regulatory protein [Burkholderiales bacterium]
MEKLSALIDGELDDQEMERQLALLKQNNDAQDSWEMFNLIGDTLRGDSRISPDFSRRIAERLALEPTMLAPQRRAAKNGVRYAMSIAASLAAVSVVAWVAFSNNPLTAPGSPASVHLAGPASAQLASINSQGQMNEYLLAHQGFSPSTAIQGVVPYIRSVSVSPTPQSR